MSSEKGNSSTKAWTPAVLAKPTDNIISSDYARKNKVFVPSYERECRPCMDQLIANEYQRIWWEERDAWAKNRPEKPKVKKFHSKTNGGTSRKVTSAKLPNETATTRSKSKNNVLLQKKSH